MYVCTIFGMRRANVTKIKLCTIFDVRIFDVRVRMSIRVIIFKFFNIYASTFYFQISVCIF